MPDPVPFTDQHAARRDLSGGRLGWGSPMTVIFCGTFEQATGRGFEAAKNSLLQPVGYRLKQKSLTDANRGCGAIEHPPALLKGGGVESAELGELVRQALSSRPCWVAAFHVRPLLRRADI